MATRKKVCIQLSSMCAAKSTTTRNRKIELNKENTWDRSYTLSCFHYNHFDLSKDFKKKSCNCKVNMNQAQAEAASEEPSFWGCFRKEFNCRIKAAWLGINQPWRLMKMDESLSRQESPGEQTGMRCWNGVLRAQSSQSGTRISSSNLWACFQSRSQLVHSLTHSHM